MTDRRDFFIDSLLQAINAPRSPLRVVITLRADFYDRPLQQPSPWVGCSRRTPRSFCPLTTEELTWSVREPARRVGVALERGWPSLSWPTSPTSPAACRCCSMP